MNTAEINGTTLSYTRTGVGVRLICLHGGMGLDSQTLRTKAIEGLATQGVELVLFDQRGHGNSKSDGDIELTHDAWAGDVIGLADHLEWDQFSLLGHSYGGFIALEVATRWPHRLSRLILLSTSAGPVVTPFPPCSSDEELSALFRERWPRFFAGEDKHWDVFDRTTFSARPFNAAFRSELPNYDLRAELEDISTPALLIAGDRDPYLAAMKHMESAMPSARLVVLNDTGHMPFLEAEAEFSRSALSFLHGPGPIPSTIT